jgi:hypothetical protein
MEGLLDEELCFKLEGITTIGIGIVNRSQPFIRVGYDASRRCTPSQPELSIYQRIGGRKIQTIGWRMMVRVSLETKSEGTSMGKAPRGNLDH